MKHFDNTKLMQNNINMLSIIYTEFFSSHNKMQKQETFERKTSKTLIL